VWSLIAASLIVGPSLTIQRGTADLTPPELLPLGGYSARAGKPMEPGGDPLYVRTTLLSSGKETWAIVVLDMLTVPESLAREVQKRVPYRLFLIATHTHCAPDSQMLNDRMTFSIPGIASYKSRWLEWYSERIAASVLETGHKPRDTIRDFSIRQQVLPLNRGRRLGALPDPTGTLIAYTCDTGRLTNLWFHFAAHAVFWGPERNQTSRDWPGAVEDALQADVLTGVIGDVSPNSPDKLAASDRIVYFRDTVVQRFPMAFGRGFSKDPLRWVEESVPLGKVQAHLDFAKSNRIPDALAQSLAQKFAPTEAHITAFRIGKLAVVGVPGEPTSHLGRRIKDYGRRIGFETVLVCSHVNGWIGYILDAKDYQRGGYEATLAMHGPGEGDSVVNAGCRALDRLAK